MEEQMINQPEEDGVTFREIFQTLKKGWITLVVTLVITVLITTAVLLTINFALSDTTYEEEITFSSASILDDDSYTPSTKTNALLKSNSVITSALTICGYTQEQQQELIKNGLVANINAYVVETMAATDESVYPFVVKIAIEKDKKLGLSNAQYSALIDELTNQVMQELRKNYTYELDFTTLDDIDFTKTNYLQAYETIDNAIANIDAFKAIANDNLKNYEVNGKSIKTILSKIDSLKSQLNSTKVNLMKNAISNSDVATTELDSATYYANLYTQRATQLQTRITNYEALLASVKPDITVTAGTITVDALKEYYELVDVYNTLEDEYAQIKEKAQEWNDLEAAYSGSTTQDESVKTSYAALVASYNSIYTELNGIVKTYNDDNNGTALITKTKSVEKNVDGAVSLTIMAIVEIVVIACCFVIVYFVEKKKQERITGKQKA